MESAAALAGSRALAICGELGFACAGIARVSPSKWGDEFRAWLGAGKHGSMDYLARNVEARLDPALIQQGAVSAVMVADLYATRGQADEGRSLPGLGRIAKYARGDDYHEVIKTRLHELADRLRAAFPGNEFRTFVDTAPVLEREHAARAGLGWIGKHTLLIHPRLGSYMLLGGIFTTLDLGPEAEREQDHCGTCTRCIDACPTDAITPYSVDASKCISYLTIERRGPIGTDFHRSIGEWLYGCDICQDVCPHNSPRPARAGSVRDEYRPRVSGFDVLKVLGWSEHDRRAAFRGSALKRATLAMMKRNAVIVAGNLYRESADPAIPRELARVAADEMESEMVRIVAAEVLAGIGSEGGAV